MEMFFGKFEHRIDEKGRVLIPPRFRRELKERVVLMPGIEKYISVYPLAERKKLAVCNFLVGLHSDGFGLEGRQLDNKGGRSRSGRF